MSTPFRSDDGAREARIEALEAEVEELRSELAPLEASETKELVKKVERLASENAKLRRELREAKVRGPRRPLTDSNAIVAWSVGLLLAIAMIIGASQNCAH